MISSDSAGREIGVLALEARLIQAGLPVYGLWSGSDDWSDYADFVDSWLDDAAEGMRLSVEEALRLVRFQTFVIASSIPAPVLVLLHGRLLAYCLR